MQARGEATFNFLKNPKILDIAESFVGSEIICNPIQHIRAVLPRERSQRAPTPWHQDAGVCWPDTDPYFMLTVWIPIVDATLENGCLQVMPGSHKMGLFRHDWNGGSGLAVTTGTSTAFDLTPKALPIRAGGVILFHNYTRFTARNRTHRRVSGGVLICVITMSINRRVVPFYPAFLMRSRLRPEAGNTQYETWCQRWEFALENSKGAQAYRWPR